MRHFDVFVYNLGKTAEEISGITKYTVTVEEKIKEGNKIIARLQADEIDLEEVKRIAALFVQALNHREAGFTIRS